MNTVLSRDVTDTRGGVQDAVISGEQGEDDTKAGEQVFVAVRVDEVDEAVHPVEVRHVHAPDIQLDVIDDPEVLGPGHAPHRDQGDRVPQTAKEADQEKRDQKPLQPAGTGTGSLRSHPVNGQAHAGEDKGEPDDQVAIG